MAKGFLGLPRLSNLRPASRVLPDVYYRVEHISNTRDVKRYGFAAGTASECSSGQGVHMFSTKSAARQWANSTPGEFKIWKITDLDKSRIVKDKYFYIPLPKAYIYCTTGGIHPDKITDTGEVL